ncbi:hypothetical protein L9F63_026816, partial [Diploptera punctata]
GTVDTGYPLGKIREVEMKEPNHRPNKEATSLLTSDIPENIIRSNIWKVAPCSAVEKPGHQDSFTYAPFLVHVDATFKVSDKLHDNSV